MKKKKAKKAVRTAPKKPTKRAPRKASPSVGGAGDSPSVFVEELEAALGELRRLSKELISTRRELDAEESAGRGTQTALKRELDTLRLELKTARAELEIARADQGRMQSRLESAAAAEAKARSSEREAQHAADRARDEVLWLRREAEKRSAPVLAAVKESES